MRPPPTRVCQVVHGLSGNYALLHPAVARAPYLLPARSLSCDSSPLAMQ